MEFVQGSQPFPLLFTFLFSGVSRTTFHVLLNFFECLKMISGRRQK